MKPIAIFYHGLFVLGDPPKLLPSAVEIVNRQMHQLAISGLLNTASDFVVGLNGGEESHAMANRIIPSKAAVHFHGLKSHSENLTLAMLQEWVKTNPGRNILYFHSKGATAHPGSAKAEMSNQWRETMMADLVIRWRNCVSELERGHDIVCSHWRWNAADGTQHIPAGNFLWITSDFAAKLPSIYLRERIKQDGIAALSSRYEAEVVWGNGPRPNVKHFRPYAGSGIPLAPQVNPS